MIFPIVYPYDWPVVPIVPAPFHGRWGGPQSHLHHQSRQSPNHRRRRSHPLVPSPGFGSVFTAVQPIRIRIFTITNGMIMEF